MNMDKTEIQEILIEAISQNADETGWAHLAKIGAMFRKQGLKYGRLSRMLKDYEDVIEMKIDDSMDPPVAYAKVIEN